MFPIIEGTNFRPAAQIVALMFSSAGPDERAIEALLKQIEVGIPNDGLDLLALPLTLSRGEYLALYSAGMKTTQQVLAPGHQAIEALLGPERSKQL